MSAGFDHTCGIIEGGIADGEAECWGSDGSGRSTPPSGVRFRALSAGGFHTCGIIEGGIADSEATCWGRNGEGESTPPSDVRFRALSAGFGHTCGIIEGGIADGEATCWGRNGDGQSTPPSDVRFRALSAGGGHTCGIIEGGSTDGEVTCWGSDGSGQSTPPPLSPTEGYEVIFIVSFLSDVTAYEDIFVDWSVSCSGDITADDFADSSCPSGTVTIPSGESSATFAVSTNDDNVAEGTEAFTVVLDSVSPDIEGRITISDTMGTAPVLITDNDSGIITISLPTRVPRFRAIGSGDNHTCGIIDGGSTDGEAICWGRNGDGQSTPPSGVRFRALSVGGSHTCGIIEGGIADGEVTCWGSNGDGESTPLSDVRFRALSAGFDHTCGIIDGGIADGEVTCWGSDGSGQSTPPLGVRFRALSGGLNHTCGIIDGGIDDGEATCWGDDGDNQSIPPSDVRFRALSAGDNHTCGIIEGGIADGEVICWGSDNSGESTPPVDVRFRALNAGGSHTCGIIDGGSTDGEATCWGSNFRGQSTPPLGVRFLALSAGFEHTCGIIDDGSDDGEATCWGSNDSGQSTPPTLPLTEGDEAIFRVGFLSDVTTYEDIFVDWSVSCSDNITADDFADSLCPSGTVTIPSGEMYATFAVSTNDDNEVEGMEEFEGTLTSVSPTIDGVITISDTMGAVGLTILDNDAVDLSIGFLPTDYRVSEDAGSVTLTVSVLSGTIEGGVNVAVSVMTVDGSAIAVEDYVSVSETLMFTSGVTELTVTVNIGDGTIPEVDETFVLELLGERVSSVSNVARVTIFDDDRGVIRVGAGSSRVDEGITAVFGVELTGGVTVDEVIGVEWSVTCDAGNGVTSADFVDGCPSGTVTIASGGSFATFTVSTSDDEVVEGIEEFAVTLLNVSPDIEGRIRISGTMSAASVTIVDNDKVDIGFAPIDYRVTEGSGSVTLTVAVLSGDIAEGLSVAVVLMTVDGTADNGDYASSMETLRFISDVTTLTVSVSISADTVVEGAEEFGVMLSGESVSESMSVATVRIRDDDRGEFTVKAVNDTISEGEDVSFRVELTGGVTADEALVVSWDVDCSGDVSMDDFVGVECPSGTVTLLSGSTSASFTIMTDDDGVVEGIEEFAVTLLSVSPDIEGRIRISGTMSAASVTIVDNDKVDIGFAPIDYRVLEGAGNVTLTVAVLSGDIAEGLSVAVVLMTVDGTADNGDYASSMETLRFSSDVTTLTVSVSISADTVVEGSEDFGVMLSGESVSESMSVATVMIRDDDRGEFTVEAVNDTISEGEDVSFRVELTGGVTASEDIGVAWSVSCGGDVSIDDFVGGECPSGTVTLLSGSTSASFTIMTNGDGVVEGVEEFAVTLLSVSPDIEGRIKISTVSTASVTIGDNDKVDIGFSPVNYRVFEGSGSVTLTVAVLSGDIAEGLSVAVVLMTVDGTAGSADYASSMETLRFISDVTTLTVSVSISADTVVEGAEDFGVMLSGESVSESMSVATVRIRDDDRGEFTVKAVNDTISEGEDVSFRVELTGGVTADEALFVSWDVDCGGDVSMDDFVGVECPSGTVKLLSGSTSASFTIMTDDDGVVEGIEEFAVTLLSVSPNIEGRITISGTMSAASVTIGDNDKVEIGFSPVNYRVTEGAGSVTLTVAVLSGDIAEGLSVAVVVMTLNGTAGIADYTSLMETLRFSSDVTTLTVSVSISADTVVEGAEEFGVMLSGESVSESMSVATVTIRGDDRGEISVDAITDRVAEGDEVAFTVELTDGVTADEALFVSWDVDCGGDVSMDDFVGVECPSGTVTLLSGSTSASFTIMTDDDGVVEGIEEFAVTLSSVSPDIEGRIKISTVSTASVTIEDNDKVDIGFAPIEYRVFEGSGSVTLTVAVLSGDIAEGLSVAVVLMTVDGTADNGDYTSLMETLRFSSDVTTLTVSVSISADTVVEGAEEFGVMLSGESVSESMSVATVRIRDDDRGEFTLAAVSPSVSERSAAVFTVELTDGVTADEALVVSWDVDCGGDVSIDDFVGGECPSGTVTLLSGSTSASFTIMTNDDGVVEGVEEVAVTLLSVSPDIEGRIKISTVSTASVTVGDNDKVDIGFAPIDYRVFEGSGSVTLTVAVLSGDIAEGLSVAVVLMTVDGTAGSADYASSMETLVFDSNVTIRTVDVSISGGDVVEGLERFVATLSSTSSDAVLSVLRATVTIEDDDRGEISLAAVSPSVSERSAAVFTVELTGGVTADEALVVSWDVDCGGDVSIDDFVGVECPSGTVTLLSGSTSASFTIMTNDDGVVEGVEEVAVTLLSVSPDIEDRIRISGTMSAASVTIVDNDVAVPSLGIGFDSVNYRVSEVAGSVTLTVSVLSGGIEAGESVTVGVSTMDVSATADRDYRGLTDTVLTFTSEAMTQTVSIDINDDASVEDSETFTIHLTTSSDVLSLSVSRAIVTILDNDNPSPAVVPSSPSPVPTSSPPPSPRRRSGGGGGGGNDEPDDIINTSDTAEMQEPPQPVTISSPNEVVMLETLNGNTPEFDVDKTVIDELNDEELMRSTAEVRPPLRVSLLYGVDVTLRDSAGADVKIVEEALRVCFPITVEITQRVNGDYEKLTIYHLMEEPSAWEEILSMYDAETEQVCGNANEFSVYALGFVDAGALLPPTGGVHIPLWALVLVALAGVLLIVVGARRVYSRS